MIEIVYRQNLRFFRLPRHFYFASYLRQDGKKNNEGKRKKINFAIGF